MRILLVDDQKTTGMALAQVLAAHGHESRLITSGEAALEAIVREDWRLIVTDWVMPGMDGVELCRRIRGRAGDPYRYIIMVTVRTDRCDRLAALEAGADDFLARPVDEDELIIRLTIADRILSMQAELEEKNARLAELVGVDPLTGLANRRRLDEVTAASPRSEEGLSTYSVVTLDIDHFKSYNDRFGHGAGDEVLRVLARLLQSGTRSADLVVRTGGEEFLIVMPETGSEEVAAIAERLRRTVADYPWPLRPVTVSLGVATSRGPLSGASYAEAVEAADRALYCAKRAGRNRVSRATSGDDEGIVVTPHIAGPAAAAPRVRLSRR